MIHIIVFVIYIFLASVFTYPLFFKMEEILLGWPLDAYNYLWNIDTFWYELRSGANPFSTYRIFYPYGTSLIFHTYAPFVSVIAAAFINKKELFLNFLVLLSPVVSAFAAYLLALKITEKKFASVVSGFVYGFSPILFSFILSQHYYFAFAAPALPLGLLFLINYFRLGKVRNIAYLFLVFWICFFTDYYTAVLYAFIVVVYTLIEFLKNPAGFRAKIIKGNFPLFNTVMLSLLVPLSLLVIFISLTSPVFNFIGQQTGYAEFCSATIIRFFIPSELNPLLSRFIQNLNSVFGLETNYDTPSYYVGFAVTITAFLTIFLLRKKEWVNVVGVGIFIFLFSLGTKTGIFYGALSKLPFLGLIDCPQRFTIGSQLILAILTGMTIAALSTHKFKHLIFALLTPLIFVEYLTFNIPYTHLEIPPIYKTLAAYPDDKTLLELPGGIADSKYAYGYDWSLDGLLLKQLYWQSIHHKNKVGGYTSRLPENYYETYKNEPVISTLFAMTSVDTVWEPVYFFPEVVDNFINKFNLGYIVLSPNEKQHIFATYIEMVFGNRISEVINDEGYILLVIN
jgi:hypothetical protein